MEPQSPGELGELSAVSRARAGGGDTVMAAAAVRVAGLLAMMVTMAAAQGGIFDDQDFDRWQPPPALFLGHGQDGTCHIARRRNVPCKVRGTNPFLRHLGGIKYIALLPKGTAVHLLAPLGPPQ